MEKGAEKLIYGERRGAVGETRGKIVVGELCLCEGHNYKIWVTGVN